MSKGWKIFFKILYYLFTFSLGIFIAIILPEANKDEISFNYLNDYIENEKFVEAIDLMAYVYDKNLIYEESIGENSGLVVFEGLSLYRNANEDGTTKVVMNEAYFFLFHNLNRQAFTSSTNKSEALINGNKIDLVIYDGDADGTYESIPSIINSNYICFTVDKVGYDKVESIKLVQADGTVFYEKSDYDLKFDSNFFVVSETFVKNYNEAYEDGDFSSYENEKLYKDYQKIHETNEDYLMIGTFTSSTEIEKQANLEATLFVFLYFVWIYILGDCLVGKRYIFKFFRFIYRKIKDKVKDKSKKEISVGDNFFSLVTFEPTICDGFNKDIIISYRGEQNKAHSFKCILTKATNYIVKERVHSGSYQLIGVECQGFKVEGLPEKIEIKGYTMLIKFSIQNENK